MGAAESNIVTIQRTVANNAQSISEVSQNLNAKIDNINIGGRNLLRDSEFNAYNKWGSPQIEFAENANRRTIKVTSTGTNGPVGIVSSNRHSTSYFQQGETYTLSLFARGSKALDYLYLMRQDGNNVRLPVINVALKLSLIITNSRSRLLYHATRLCLNRFSANQHRAVC